MPRAVVWTEVHRSVRMSSPPLGSLDQRRWEASGILAAAGRVPKHFPGAKTAKTSPKRETDQSFEEE